VDGSSDPTIAVQVAYALPDRQVVLAVEASLDSTVRDVIETSGILDVFPGIRLAEQAVGIFGRVVSLDEPVRDGDRVEIYRPLPADPRSRRRREAGARIRGQGTGRRR